MSKTLTIPDNWSATDIPDLTGKRFLITGATSGIGLAAASERQLLASLYLSNQDGLQLE